MWVHLHFHLCTEDLRPHFLYISNLLRQFSECQEIANLPETDLYSKLLLFSVTVKMWKNDFLPWGEELACNILVPEHLGCSEYLAVPELQHRIASENVMSEKQRERCGRHRDVTKSPLK